MGLIVTVREAVTGDAGAILSLHRAVLEERDYFITLPTEFGGTVYAVVQHIRDSTRRPTSLFLVAEVDGEIKGFLTVRGGALARMSHTGKLEIMVDRHTRGKGLGRRLMDVCMDWAKGEPVLEKLGLSVFANNERAVELYRTYGFEEEGRRVREYRLRDGTYRDDILMYCWV